MKLVRILLPIDQGGTSPACVKAALTLAKQFSAELEVLHPCLAAWQRLPYATELSPYYFQELINTGSEQVTFEKGEAKAWCDEAVKSSGVAIEFCSIEGLIGPTVAMRARVSDLTVLPTIEASQSSFWTTSRDAALFDSGRPMLAVPEGSPVTFGETVVIAWKDNGEATRAISAAKPFLATAKRVRLIAVDEGDEEEDQSLPAMADYLGRAGFEVESARVECGSREVGAALLQEASSAKKGMLVMGAYGHRRWKEWAFGGVTQYVLRHATLPVLMMH
jgi:nucleotide-binding universal stress UspA family protein